MKNKKKILCVCAKGSNRSKYLAQYLRKKEYSTRYGGIEDCAIKPLKKEYVDWADIIIIVRKRLLKIFKIKFPKTKNKIILLDVTDSRRIAEKIHPELKALNHEQFQKKWTRPLLRKAIKPYLPLK
jgi:predicted protein tyrosine phosphatase